MSLDLTKAISINDFLKALYKKIFRIAEGGVTPAAIDVNVVAGISGSTSVAALTDNSQKTQLVSSAGVDRSGVCGGTVLVTPSADAFDHPSFIECAGADGTITGVDEAGNTVTTYPMTVGKITASRWTKVTAASAGVIVWRHYTA